MNYNISFEIQILCLFIHVVYGLFVYLSPPVFSGISKQCGKEQLIMDRKMDNIRINSMSCWWLGAHSAVKARDIQRGAETRSVPASYLLSMPVRMRELLPRLASVSLSCGNRTGFSLHSDTMILKVMKHSLRLASSEASSINTEYKSIHKSIQEYNTILWRQNTLTLKPGFLHILTNGFPWLFHDFFITFPGL